MASAGYRRSAACRGYGSPYDIIRGIGHRADHENVHYPLAWHALGLVGTALQIVRWRVRHHATVAGAPPPPSSRYISSQLPGEIDVAHVGLESFLAVLVVREPRHR